jgi:hypothetical protein
MINIFYFIVLDPELIHLYFLKKHHDVFVLDRFNKGKIKKKIKIDKGLSNGAIDEKSVYLRFIDPSEIHKCDF